MLVEPILYTNLYGEKLILSNGNLVDPEFDKEWKFITPTLYHRDFLNNFLRIKNENNLNSVNYIIHTDSFGLPQLRSMSLSANIVNKLNEEGLYIFLTETLIKYQGEKMSLDRQDLINVDNINIKKFKFDYVNQPVGCIQFDDIDQFIKNNNLKNVNVCVIEKDYANVFASYNTFNIKYYDSFLVEYLGSLKKTKIKSTKLNYKFLSYNFRYASHRHLTCAFLVNKLSKLSWAFEGTLEDLDKNLYFSILDLKHFLDIKQGITILNKKVPLSLDIEYNKMSIHGKVSDLFLLPSNNTAIPKQDINFLDTFCSVVCESEFFECTANISEKTLMSIRNKKPFVVVGSPETLRLLKDLGFKTFDNYWSEEYDLMYKSQKRLDAVFDTINFIDQYSLDQCQNMLDDMQDILDHNYKNLEKLKLRMSL